MHISHTKAHAYSHIATYLFLYIRYMYRNFTRINFNVFMLTQKTICQVQGRILIMLDVATVVSIASRFLRGVLASRSAGLGFKILFLLDCLLTNVNKYLARRKRRWLITFQSCGCKIWNFKSIRHFYFQCYVQIHKFQKFY